jgi:hypothetical protein
MRYDTEPIERAFVHHVETGRLRSWHRRTDAGPRVQYIIQAPMGNPIELNTVREAWLMCQILAGTENHDRVARGDFDHLRSTTDPKFVDPLPDRDRLAAAIMSDGRGFLANRDDALSLADAIQAYWLGLPGLPAHD